MRLKISAAFYSIIVGTGIITIWSFLFANNQIPELNTEPYSLAFHIAAEFITAIALIISGIDLLLNKKFAYKLYLISLGMLFYTLIMSPGYYIQTGNSGSVIMFVLLFLIALFFFIMALLKEKSFMVDTL